MNRFFLISISCLLLLACNKNEPDTDFKSEDKIFFGAVNASDSLVHSFANEQAVEFKELRLTLKLMGKLSDKDRTAEVVVDGAESTALPSEYELGNAIIPAGSSIGYIPLKIVNSDRLKTGKVQLALHLRNSSDFLVEPVKPGKFNELVKFKVIWTDVLIPPAGWPTGWGGYSEAKHRLVIDLTGHFVYTRFSFRPEFYVIGICNQWLDAYNVSHTVPYMDENGNKVRFCGSCL